jgi:arylsulfatase A-like enzyme
MFDGGSRVPMILRAPGLVKAGTENSALFSHADFLSSFAQIAGAKFPLQESADSQNMAEVLLGNDTIGRDNLVTEGIGSKTVLRQGNWVYIPPHEGPQLFADKGIETGNDLKPQLYNMDIDIGQRDNIAEKNIQKVEELHSLLEQIHGDTPPEGYSPVDVCSF